MKQLRMRQGLTQKALGELCGIAEPTIRRYENGKLKPKIETSRKIASALGVSVGDLMEWADFDRQAPEHLADEVTILDLAQRIGGLTCEAVELFSQLNEQGQKKAVDYITDLLKIDEYRLSEE